MSGINGGIVKPDHEGPWPGNMLCYIAVDEGRMMGLWKTAM